MLLSYLASARVFARRAWSCGVGVLTLLALVFGFAALSACTADSTLSAPVTTAAPVGTAQGVPAGTGVPLPPVPQVPPVGSLAEDADPRTVYVDPVAGDDNADGQTSARAWRSLQAALDRLTPGMTLYLLDGEYRDTIKPGTSHFLVLGSGRPDAWIRIAAAPGAAPVVVATGGNGIEIGGSYIEVTGLTIRGDGFGGTNDYGWGILTRTNHHVRITGNTVSNMPVGGIGSVESSNLEISGNTVFDNSFWGPEQGSGISLWRSRDHGTAPADDGYHDRIVGNIVYRNENKVVSMWRDNPVITDGNGIIIDFANELGYRGRFLVANNLVFDNGGRGILVLESSQVDVVHNTTYHNGRTIGLEGGPTELAVARAGQIRVLNNLAWSRPGAVALVVDDVDGLESGGNVFVTDNGDQPRSSLDTVLADPGVANASTDPATANFRPAAASVLRDAALPVDPPVLVDADLRPRPEIGADVGAYERAP